MYVLLQVIIIFQKEALTIFKIYFFIYYNIKYNKKIGILNTKKLYISIIKLLTLEKALVSCGKMNIRKNPVIAAIHLIVLLRSKSKRLFTSTVKKESNN